jgi:hypothetical protein
MRATRILAAAALALFCGSTSAQPLLGALGDSLTDEYFEDGYGYAYNWPSHLVLSRGIGFGPTAVQASQPGGTWGEPRRTGYRDNWARSGATTQSLLTQGQHTGLAGSIASGGLTHAVVWAGANDFHFGPFGPYHSIYSNLWSTQQVQQHVEAAAANIDAALQALSGTGARIILVNVPDYGYAPLVTALYTNPPGRQRVSNAISQLNDRLRTIASQRQVMLVDAFGLMQGIFGTHTLPVQTLLVGNVEINLQLADTSSNSRPWAAFVHDGVHPHTTLQGMMANLVITAMNMRSDLGIPVLSEAEILARAGLVYGGQNTLEMQIGPYSDYIENFGCYSNCDRSTGIPILNVEDFTCFINLFAQGDPRANCDESTAPPALNVEDFTCFINRFAQGCP